MSKKMNFVRTKDEATAADLRRAGLVEIEKQGAFFVFINDQTRKFENDSIDESKVSYTNMMHV